ncbi:MAG: hypothetical protein ACREFP_17720 [Acetobacteraceae bacterium]
MRRGAGGQAGWLIDIADIRSRWRRAERFLDERGGNAIGERVRRPGGGRESVVAHQAGLPAALEALPEGLQETAMAEAPQAIADRDLDTLATTEPPRDYGRG